MSVQYVEKNADAVGTVGEPYNISGSNDQLQINVDGTGNQTFSLTNGSTRTATQVAADINATITGAVASVATVNSVNFVRIRTTSASGNSSTIVVNAPANNSNALLGLTATTYTGGSNVNQGFLGSTRQNIINGCEAALLNAGWITISGSGTGTLVMQSAMSPNPQNLRCRVTFGTPGSNSVCVSIRNVDGTKSGTNGTSAGAQLFPTASKGFRVIANKYQVFVLVPGSIASRDFAAFGIPYIPTHLQGLVWEAIWLHGNAQSDTDTTTRPSFRSSLTSEIGGAGQQQCICNGNIWEGSPFNLPGPIAITGFMSAKLIASNSSNGTRWHDGSTLMSDPLICWGLSSSSEEGLIRGQLWDAFVVMQAFPGDTQLTSVDSRNWWGITHNNGGSNFSSTNIMQGTLFMVIP